MIYLNEILKEILKFEPSSNYQKYLDGNTFGIEFEYKPAGADFTDTQVKSILLDKIGNAEGGILNDFIDWLNETNQTSIKNDIEERYGSVDSVNDQIKFSGLSDQYIYNVGRKFVNWLYKNKKYKSYFTDDELKSGNVNFNNHIDDATDYLTNTLNQTVVNNDIHIDEVDYKNEWNVLQDGYNVEIASKILTLNDYDNLVGKLIEWIKSNYPNQSSESSGLHVHIGVPKGYDVYNALYTIYLMDEQSLPNEIRSSDYTKPKRSIFKKITDQILNLSSDKKIVIDKAKFRLGVANYFNKYYGINMLPIFKKENATIEFRYLGITQIDNLKEWIKYYIAIVNKGMEDIKEFSQEIEIDENKNAILTIRDLGKNLQFELK